MGSSSDGEVDPSERTEAAAPAGLTVSTDRRLRASVKARVFANRLPERIGRYALEKQLGQGGMGTVYLAYDDQLERKVAIKLLTAGTVQGSEGEARLQREAKALARLSHPNVVHVYEVGSHENQIFVAMEFVPGQTLREWTQEEARSLQDVLDMFAQAGLGLAAAHDAGLIHRDFKPDNVLVGNDGRARVLDFGLARPHDTPPHPEKRSGDSIDVVTLTATGAIMGTPAYMAPEQFEGGATHARTDQFAFCVSLFEAVYGRRPFQGSTIYELATAVSAGRIDAAPPKHVPTAIAAAIRRGLAVDPTARHDSMRVLLDALKTREPPPSRNRTSPVLIVAAMLVVGGAVAWQAYDRPPSATPPQTTPERNDGAASLTALGGREMIEAAAAKSVSCQPERCEVSREFMQGISATPEVLRTQARFSLEKNASGRAELRLYGVRKESLPGQLGLRNNDVLLEIAGQSVDAWPTPGDGVADLSGRDEFEVVFERAGEPRRLLIAIR